MFRRRGRVGPRRPASGHTWAAHPGPQGEASACQRYESNNPVRAIVMNNMPGSRAYALSFAMSITRLHTEANWMPIPTLL